MLLVERMSVPDPNRHIDAAFIDVEEGMETKITEIADGIYRLSTYVPHIAPPAGFLKGDIHRSHDHAVG